MPIRNINLTEHLDDFVAHQVASGRYLDASEIVRDALRLLEEQDQEHSAKIQLLRQAALKGFDEIDQGQGIVLNGRAAINQFMAVIEAEVLAKPSQSGG